MDDCRQLIYVTAPKGSSRAKIIRYERMDLHAPWTVAGKCDGWVGKNGIRENRHTGDLTTPAGVFPLGLCFGCAPKPTGVNMPWRDVTPCSEWVGDPNSSYFNSWQERSAAPDWDTTLGERLADYPEEYACACVIGFNLPPEPDPLAGFAIFLHVSEKPTAGCVGIPKNEMVQTLQWLDPMKNPHILICEA